MTKQFKAILFDLDGTLLNTSKDLQKALHEVQKYYRIPLTSLIDTQTYMGYGIQSLVDSACASLNECDKKGALLLFHQVYATCFNHESKPYVGIIKGLKQCKEKGIKLAVISNKANEYTQILIDTHFKEIQFDYVLGASSTVLKKPFPDMLNQAIKVLHMEAKDCLYVGDTEVDVQAANAAMMDVMVVGWGYRDLDSLRKMNIYASAHSVEDCFSQVACV